jgi:hypothetical protein
MKPQQSFRSNLGAEYKTPLASSGNACQQVGSLKSYDQEAIIGFLQSPQTTSAQVLVKNFTQTTADKLA